MRIIVDGKPIPAERGETVLVAMLKADQHPTGGGCLCLAGDCPHCLATVDGVSYVRTCQTRAKPGMVIERHHRNGQYPPLPTADRLHEEVKARNIHCDVVVIGQGEAGRAAAAAAEGKHVVTVDAAAGQEAIAIYAGPRVVVRTDREMLYLHPQEEIVVATGAAEIQPVAPGAELAGLLTSRAAEVLAAAGIDLGRVVAFGTPPQNIDAELLQGEIVCFEGENQVEEIVMRDANGVENRHKCDTVALGLGFHPRDALALMGHGLPVRTVGDAALEADVPSCPAAGIVCACSGVSVDDLNYTWESGFREMELIKRSTLAGTGTCQGMGCLPYLRSFIQEKGGELQPRFTARPVNRQLTMGEIAAGAHHHAMARTALDEVHRQLGANMERSGGWWRPWNYGKLQEEYWAVREGVSIMDVSTLGKMTISGPDALEFLERIYPTHVRTIRPGRTRYALLLNERGYVMDDGLIGKENDTRFTITLTSGGTSHSEMWLRDWARGWGLDVRILNQTYTLGAINVTGPLARTLLERAGMSEPLKFMRFRDQEIAGVSCRVFRLSFTGEESYELHHPAEDSVKLWRALMELGADLGIKPHGLEALVMLRLEKGHIIVGQDTDYDSTPRRIHHEWMVKPEKEFFLGRTSMMRTGRIELDKMLVGFEVAEGVPQEGAVVWHDEEYAGYLTSAAWSPVLQKGIALGWLYYQDGELPTDVTINGQPARRVDLPFYDKEAARARA